MHESVILHAIMTLSLQEPDLPPALLQKEPEIPPALLPKEGCYPEVGCMSLDPPWTGPERPTALYPEHDKSPHFCLHTPAHPNCHELSIQDLSSLHQSGLHPTTRLYMLTHGYLESSNLPWMQEMVQAILHSGGSEDMGVITVDWSEAAHPPYSQAVANIRLVGALSGLLLVRLMEEVQANITSTHLVGHSLGSHLFSYAANFVFKNTMQRVGRITGLDPAGPFFSRTPPEVRLDSDDALFVDVIHTDMPINSWQLNKLGYQDPLGDVDYYPNGGSEQPGCEGSAHRHVITHHNLAQGVLSYIGCHHQRSHQYFIEAIISKCPFVGVACESWEKYLEGECWGCHEDEHCYSLGISHPTSYDPYIQNTENKNMADDITEKSLISSINLMSKKTSHSKLVFMGTSSESPFCAAQYRVTVTTSVTPASIRSGGDFARFTVTLRGALGQYTIPAPKRAKFVESGGKISWVGFCHHLGVLEGLQLDYEENNDILQALIWRFSNPTIYLQSIVVEELVSAIKTVFPCCDAKMEAGESWVIFPDKVCDVPAADGSSVIQ